MANMYMGDQALGTVSVVLNTADATATAADILKDKTAYVGDKKVVGTHECEPAENLDTELSTQDDLIAQLATALEGKAGASGGESTSGVIFAGYVTATDSKHLSHESLQSCSHFALMLSIDRDNNYELDMSGASGSDGPTVISIIHNFFNNETPFELVSYANGGYCWYPPNNVLECILSQKELYLYTGSFNTTANAYYLISWGSNSGTPYIINFTINGTSYYAKNGMTWQKWIESEYNTGGYYIRNNYVCFPDGSNVTASGTGMLNKTSSIVAGYAYYKLDNGSN